MFSLKFAVISGYFEAKYTVMYADLSEYGSTLYVGMTQKKNGGRIKRVRNLMLRTLPWM